MASVLATVTQTVLGALSQAIGTAAAVTHLGELSPLVDGIPVALLLVGHCLAVAGITRGRYASQLLTYIHGFILAFGGGIASSYFLGTGTNSVLFKSNDAVAIWTAAWWLVNHNPVDLIAPLFDLAPVGIFARASLQTLRAGVVVAQINAAAKLFPGLVAPAIVAGVLAGSGGKIITDLIANSIGYKAPFELATPSYVLRSAVVASATYYTTVHWLGALSAVQGKGLVLLAFLLHSLADDVLGVTYDYTEPVAEVFFIVTFMKARAPGRGRTVAAAAPATPRSASKTVRKTRSKAT